MNAVNFNSRIFNVFEFLTAVFKGNSNQMNILKKIKMFKRSGESAEDAKQGQSGENEVSKAQLFSKLISFIIRELCQVFMN